MSTALAERNGGHVAERQHRADALEKVVAHGDLKALTAEERVSYYKAVCESVGLNPLTRPFEFITLSGKLVLYARKDCTDQLRALNGVSITRLERNIVGDQYVVTAYARDRQGREDSDIGCVPVKGLTGDNWCNAAMKATTKAKRRVTLSICGLGFLDESEVETVPDAQPFASAQETSASRKLAAHFAEALRDCADEEELKGVTLRIGEQKADMLAADLAAVRAAYAQALARVREAADHPLAAPERQPEGIELLDAQGLDTYWWGTIVPAWQHGDPSTAADLPQQTRAWIDRRFAMCATGVDFAKLHSLVHDTRNFLSEEMGAYARDELLEVKRRLERFKQPGGGSKQQNLGLAEAKGRQAGEE